MNPIHSFSDQSRSDNDPFELKVLSYNIWGWTSPFDIRLELFAQGIAELNPHLVGLQEVMESPGSDGSDNSAVLLRDRLEELTGETWYLYKENSWNFGDSMFGFGILSRYPIFQTGYRFIPRGEFDRILQWAQIETPIGFISFYNTHLSYGDQWETRIEQAEKIKGFIRADDTTKLHISTILTGDFNDVPGSVPINTFTEAGPDSFRFYDTWDVVHPGEPGYTVPSWEPSIRIDYVFLKAMETGRIVGSEVVFAPPDSDGVNPSDHCGVLSIIEYDVNVFDIDVLSPVEGDTVMGIVSVQWDLSGASEDIAVSAWVSDDNGSTWETLLWNEPGAENFLWNTENYTDGTHYKLKIYAQGASSVGMCESPGPFTLNNPGNAPPEIEILSPEEGIVISGQWPVHWSADDADGDELILSMECSSDGGTDWESLFSGPGVAGEYIWDTSLFPNSPYYRLSLSCTDGSVETNLTTGMFEVYNERSGVIPARQFHHAAGYGDASILVHVVDPDLLTGEKYRITFNDSIPANKMYDVMNVKTGMSVVRGVVSLDDRIEGPYFDGLRLVIGDLEETVVDYERSGWTHGSSTLEATIYLPSINFGGEIIEGYPYPADYVIAVFDHVVDTSASAFGASETEMMFTVMNRTEDRQIDIAFIDGDGNHALSRFDELFFLEPSDGSEFVLTWAVFFGGQAGAILPQPGDEFSIRTLKPLSTDDVYEFVATLTLVELARIDVSPSSVDLLLGETQQFKAAGFGVDGLHVFPPITPEWSVTGGNIDSDGLFTATEAGDFTVTASVDNSPVTGSATVRVISCAVMGDVNSDGRVDVTDVLAMVNHILGLGPNSIEPECADVNRDEKIDILDVIVIIQMILNP